MDKIYNIQLSGHTIGTTHFEYADVPMGVVYGKIDFDIIGLPYEFIKNY